MSNQASQRGEELRDIISQRLTALMAEMEAADWSAQEVALAINDCLKIEWLAKVTDLQEAKRRVAPDFLSDGNEG